MSKDAKPVPYKGLYEWMQGIVVVLLAVLMLLTFVGQITGVQGFSMMPTLLERDRMIVRSIFYTPARDDLVVFARKGFQDDPAMVKRVIALAGDVVDIDTAAGVVYVNGTRLYEPYTMELTHRSMTMSFPFVVPPGHVFVLGDNRQNSTDSRDLVIGAVDEREIIGQVVAVILPFSRARLFS